MMDGQSVPSIVVFSSLFPSEIQPGAGLFIRERMFRVGKQLPLSVVAPTPWFPFQGVLHRFRPHFRPGAPEAEIQQGFTVSYPRFLSIPGLLKRYDGFFMALGAFPVLRRLKNEGRLDLIDAHFAYPDGYAATLIGGWLKVPVTITLRGTETRHIQDPRLAGKVLRALQRATQVFSVSEALRNVVVTAGADASKIEVVGNGVDAARFSPKDREASRRALQLPSSAKVLVTVGGLVPRKGFHRVIDIIPQLLKRWPDLVYLIVGGASAEGNNRKELEDQVAHLGLQNAVRFLGPRPPHELAEILSASDLFVLATSNEGWANVLLEAMGCGLPVVTTDVGGNREVVCHQGLGTVVPFGDPVALAAAITAALENHWDRQVIRAYAATNSWDERVDRLCTHFLRIANTLARSPT